MNTTTASNTVIGMANAAAISAAQTSNAPAPVEYLSADAIMAYCTAQLNSIDSTLQAAMQQQETQGNLAKQWTQFETLLEGWTCVGSGADVASTCSGAAGEAGMGQQLMAQYAATNDPALQGQIAKAYQEVTGNDIQTAISQAGGTAAAAAKDTAYWSLPPGNDPTTNNPPTGLPPCLNTSGIGGPNATPAGSGVDSTTWANEVQDAKDGGSAVTQGNDLQMVQIQQWVSDRQQAIQLTTQMLQAYDDGKKGIIGNIGGGSA